MTAATLPAMIDSTTVSRFPGAELVLPGLEDLAAGRLTIAACLVSMARPTIEKSGLAEGFRPLRYVSVPEQTLYRLLRAEGGDPYGRYNSLSRRLVSFERALRRTLSARNRQS
ncbi:MAG: hypothetical protein DME97_16640 [Verrucomicrobia bacterium]|nr:MAG: hypothetical protein DME97_16640 [Verrucomicrobiota bacterium]